MPETQLYNKLKNISRKKGFSMNELVNKIGMTPRGLKLSIENNTIKVETAIHISKILEINPSFFFSENSDTNNLNEPFMDYKKSGYETVTYYKNLYYKTLEEKDRIRDKLEVLQDKYIKLCEEKKLTSGESKTG